MNRPKTPTTCNTSDMLNGMADFVQDCPDWQNNPDMVQRMGMAYVMLTNMADPADLTNDEYDFVMTLHEQIEEARNG